MFPPAFCNRWLFFYGLLYHCSPSIALHEDEDDDDHDDEDDDDHDNEDGVDNDEHAEDGDDDDIFLLQAPLSLFAPHCFASLQISDRKQFSTSWRFDRFEEKNSRGYEDFFLQAPILWNFLFFCFSLILRRPPIHPSLPLDLPYHQTSRAQSYILLPCNPNMRIKFIQCHW